ncbi:MAG TPA: hypothetical protein VGJ84_19105 [Polyangiaceae bacterium]|jgi:hypothetical protein
MASAKATTVRFGPEDLAIIEEVQHRTGLFAQSDALRFILRQYAQQNGIELVRPKQKRKR